MRVTLISIFTILSFQLFSSDISLNSKVSAVTIFLSKAEVSRTIKGQVPSGNHHLIIKNLSTKIDGSSIQVGGRGDFILLGSKFRKADPSAIEGHPSVKALIDSLSLIRSKKNTISSKLNGLKSELELLQSNKVIGSEDTKITVNELKAMGAFFRERVATIEGEKFKLNLDLEEFGRLEKSLNKRLTKMKGELKRSLGEIVIEIEANKLTNVSIDLDYVTSGASWFPEYNLRSNDLNPAMRLEQYAILDQQTGEDWTNVSLSLSTKNPLVSNIQPTIYPWYLNIVEQSQYFKARPAVGVTRSEVAFSDKVEAVDEFQSTEDFIETVEQTLALAYQLDIPYTIKSGEKQRKIAIQSKDLEAEYYHYSAPKLRGDAFLMARIKDWDNSRLLPGKLNLFLDGTYMGEGFLDPLQIDENLEVSLGVDQKVLVSRKDITDYSKDQLFGSKRKRLFSYEIEVRNLHKKDVVMEIQDQIPISQNEEISVDIMENDEGELNKKNGVLTWKKSLKPLQKETISLSFEVKYPNGKKIRGL